MEQARTLVCSLYANRKFEQTFKLVHRSDHSQGTDTVDLGRLNLRLPAFDQATAKG